MDQTEALALLRHALTTGGGYLVASGVITGTQVEPIVGALIVLITVSWSILQKRQQKAAVIAATTAKG